MKKKTKQDFQELLKTEHGKRSSCLPPHRPRLLGVELRLQAGRQTPWPGGTEVPAESSWPGQWAVHANPFPFHHLGMGTFYFVALWLTTGLFLFPLLLVVGPLEWSPKWFVAALDTKSSHSSGEQGGRF